MSTLVEKINDEIKKAMLAKEKVRLEASEPSRKSSSKPLLQRTPVASWRM